MDEQMEVGKLKREIDPDEKVQRERKKIFLLVQEEWPSWLFNFVSRLNTGNPQQRSHYLVVYCSYTLSSVAP